MISPTAISEQATARSAPTVWGLSPSQVHDRFWAARGVQVVRQGEPSEIVNHAELFLLTDRRLLTIFKIRRLVDQLSWLAPEMMVIRLHEARDHGYREVVVTDERSRFVRFHRQYGASDARLARVALTPSRRVAELWQSASDPKAGWRELRRRVGRARRTVVSVDANVYDRTMPEEVMQCLRDLVQVWKTPDATISRVRKVHGDVWSDRATQPDGGVRFTGPAWIGAGRSELPATNVVGPAVLWDDPAHRPDSEDLQWQEIEPSQPFERPVQPRRRSSFTLLVKRAFDVAFSLAVLVLTLPLYPLIMLAIWLEDGRPFFFVHRRETLGGREFPCVKFRSMRKDAERIKADLQKRNKADGPQFFMEPDDDPRLTHVGRVLRKLNLDEIPQFVNVLRGEMSVVGPRPSPRAENQCCPSWREARLSVRPGITGLWQVQRTREAGMDFQEWIRFDIAYVEKASWRLDLYIIWRTVLIMLKLSD